MLPHYQLTNDKGAYHSFMVGNLKMIMCDTRSFLSKSSGSILGDDQVNYIKTEITSAYTDANVSSVILNFPQTWNYVKDRYSMDMIKQDFISIAEDMEKDKKSIGDHVKQYNFKSAVFV